MPWRLCRIQISNVPLEKAKRSYYSTYLVEVSMFWCVAWLHLVAEDVADVYAVVAPVESHSNMVEQLPRNEASSFQIESSHVRSSMFLL